MLKWAMPRFLEFVEVSDEQELSRKEEEEENHVAMLHG